jgi:hypothetical protein
VGERIGVTVAQTQVALEHITNLAVFRQAAGREKGSQLLQRLACLLLNIVQLGLYGLVEAVHLSSPFWGWQGSLHFTPVWGRVK